MTDMASELQVEIKEEPRPSGYADEVMTPSPAAAISSTTSAPAKEKKGSKSGVPQQIFLVKAPPPGTPMPTNDAIVKQILESGLLQPNAHIVTNTGQVIQEGSDGPEVKVVFESAQASQENKMEENQEKSNTPEICNTTSESPKSHSSSVEPQDNSPDGASGGVTLIVPTSVPGKSGPGATKQVLLVHPSKRAGSIMTSILKSPAVNPSLQSKPGTSVSSSPQVVSLLKPPALTPCGPIGPQSSWTPVSGSHIIGTIQSVQSQADTVGSMIGAGKQHNVLQNLVKNVKSTPPPKLHRIIQNTSYEDECELSENGNLEQGPSVEQGPPEDVTVINEKVQTLSDRNSIFGLMRAFYTVSAKTNKPIAYKQFLCNFCKCKTWDQQIFLDHITTHLFVCARCSYRAFSRADVVSHIIRKHPGDKGDLPSLHAMHLENVSLKFQNTKDGQKAPVSNVLAGTDIQKMSKNDCLPVVVNSDKDKSQKEFQTHLKNYSLTANFTVADPNKVSENDTSKESNKLNDSKSSDEPELLDTPPKLDDVTSFVQKHHETDVPSLRVIAKTTNQKRQRNYRCTHCSFFGDTLEVVKNHYIQKHNKRILSYKSLPTKYYNLICPYCMLQMHDPNEIEYHLKLRHGQMSRKLVIGVRSIPNGNFTFVCNQCGASSPVKGNMLCHILFEHESDHLLDALLYIYKAGIQQFIEHIRGLIRQTFNDQSFNFPDIPELQDSNSGDDISQDSLTLDASVFIQDDRLLTEDGSTTQGSTPLLSQDGSTEYIVLQDDPPDLQPIEDLPLSSRSTKIKVVTNNAKSKRNMWTKDKTKLEQQMFKTLKIKDLPQAEVIFLNETPPELLKDPRPHFVYNSTLKRASCKKCAFVTFGSNAHTHIREHVTGIHFRGRIWGCPYCPSLRMRRAEIIRHVVCSHQEKPVKIVRRKPYEQGSSGSSNAKTMVTSRSNASAKERYTSVADPREGAERLECWQCPFCPRRDKSWMLMVNHLRFVHIDQEFKPVKWLRPTPSVKLKKSSSVIKEVAKMKPYVFALRVEDMPKFLSLKEVLDNKESDYPEPSRTTMLPESAPHKNLKYGCALCDFLASGVFEVKHHVFSHHPGEQLVAKDFRVSKLQKGKTERILFLCPGPGCDFQTPMVKALQVHSVKHPGHFSNVEISATPDLNEATKNLRVMDPKPTVGMKHKQTARKSTASAGIPNKKRKLSPTPTNIKPTARKSTARPTRSPQNTSLQPPLLERMVPHSEDSRFETDLIPTLEIKTEPVDDPDLESALGVADLTDTFGGSIHVPLDLSMDPPDIADNSNLSTGQSSSSEEENSNSSEPPDLTCDASNLSSDLPDLAYRLPNLNAAANLSLNPPNLMEVSNLSEDSNLTSVVAEPIRRFSNEEFLKLVCTVCSMKLTGVTAMKDHLTESHPDRVPVAIDLAAKEAKKPQRLHICTQPGCFYTHYREWKFKAHVELNHDRDELGYDTCLLHDGQIIRRGKRHKSESTPGKGRGSGAKRIPMSFETRQILSDFTRSRHEFARQQKRNRDCPSEEVSPVRATRQQTMFSASENTKHDDDDTDEESPYKDPVHEPRTSNDSDSDSRSKKSPRSRRKRRNEKHGRYSYHRDRGMGKGIVVTDPDGRRKLVYPYQGVDSVTVRYKCSYCDHSTNDLRNLRGHIQTQHFQLEQKAVDLRRKAARQRSGLYFCPTGTCKMHTYEYERYIHHQCSHDLTEDECVYQCKTCHLTTRDLSEMEDHIADHPAGYMVVDAKNVPDTCMEEESVTTEPGALLGSTLFQNDYSGLNDENE